VFSDSRSATTTSGTPRPLLKSRCMNQLLFDRSTGSLSPQAFSRINSSQLLYAIQQAPRLRFDSGELESRPPSTENVSFQACETGDFTERRIWAHQAGVNALAVDGIDGRYLVSGGADSSIKLWDLEENSQGSAHTFRPIATVGK
jgi:DNA excision repair protein ERCC-8